ncbi:MAG: hypothetical protein IJX16_07275 [Clostridia bacterium]|nr:hypothetical protein [Clostridia bacterium]
MDKSSTVNHSSTNNPASFLRVLYKNTILIILITILCGLCGVLYSITNVKPVYTASRSVILRTSVSTYDSTTTVQGSVTLAKMYLPDVEKAMKTPNVISLASEKYGVENGKLSASRVSVKYGTDSLIFKVSYKAGSAEEAKGKLAALIEAASVSLPDLIEADDVSLINVQNDANVTVSSAFNKYIIYGVFLGILISIGIVVIRYAMDNTVKSKTEYEYITGVSVIAVIDKIDDKDN